MADPQPQHPLARAENSDYVSSYVNGITIPGVNLTDSDREGLFNAITQPGTAYAKRMQEIVNRLSAEKPQSVKDINATFKKIHEDVERVGVQRDIKALAKPVDKAPPQTAPPPAPGYWNAFNRGIAEELSQLDRFAANVISGVAPATSERLRARSKEVEKESREMYGAEPQHISEKALQGIGSGATSLIRHALGTELLGPIIGPLTTEVITNLDEGAPGVEKAILNTASMLAGFGLGKKFVGPIAQKMLAALPKEYAAKLPANFAELVAGAVGVGATGQGVKAATGQPTSISDAVAETLAGFGIPLVHRGMQKYGGKASDTSKSWFGKKKDSTEPKTTQGTAPPPPSSSQKYQLTPDTSGAVIDPYTKQSIQLQPNETAYHIGDSTYIVTPTGSPNSYKIAEGSNRRHIARVGGVQSPEALALNVHAQRTSQPGWANRQAQSTSAPKPTTTPPPTQQSTPTAEPPAQAPPPAQPAESGNASTIKVRKGGTAVVEFATEAERKTFEAVNKYREQSNKGVHPSDEVQNAFNQAVKEYADKYKVSTEEAQKALLGWGKSVFFGAQSQVPEGKTASVKAKGIPAPQSKKDTATKKTEPTPAESAATKVEEQAPATPLASSAQAAQVSQPTPAMPTPPPAPSIMEQPAKKAEEVPVPETPAPPSPVAEAPAVAPEPVKPEATTTETVVTPTPEAPVSPLPVKPQAPGKKEKVEASVAATPAPPPVAAAKATEPAVAPKVETETVTTEAPTVEIEAPTPGKYKHYFRKDKDAELSFDSQGDLAIGLAIGNKALERHIPKLATIYVNDKPIIGNRDLSINLMREYQGYLREMPGGKAPTIEEFAKNIWKDKSKVTGVGVTKSTPIPAGISETEGTQTQTRYLDRIKFLRQSIATAKAILGTEAESAKQLSDLESKRGQFGGGKVNEYAIRHSDLESTSPGGELNEKAKVDLDKHQKELDQILNTPEGKKALELEAAQKTEQAEQAKRIAAASKRPARPIPVMEADLTPKPAPESKAAEILAKVEPKPVDYVPTLADVKTVSKKIGQAKEWLEDDQSVLNIRDTNETIKKAAIQKRKAELEGQAALVADLSKKKTALPASEAIKRPGLDPADLAREKAKLEKLREDIAMRESELARYQKEQLAKAKQAVKESQDRLDALRQEHAALMDRLENIPDLQVKKAVQTEINKGNVRINDLEAKVKQLQDKFMSEKQRKQTSKTESAEPKETTPTQDLFPQAVEHAKKTGIVSRASLRKALSKYGLPDKQINDMYKRLKEEGVLNEKGEAVKPEPTPVVKPEEPKPSATTEKAKPSENKPKTETKPKEEVKPKPEEEPKEIKVEAPAKPTSAKFASDADAKAYDVWKKDPVRFGTAASEGAKVFEEYRKSFRDKNPDLNKTEAMRYINKHMEYADKQAKAGKQIDSIDKRYKVFEDNRKALMSKNSDLNKAEATRYVEKYMEYADKQVEQKKPVDSLDKWYRDNV